MVKIYCKIYKNIEFYEVKKAKNMCVQNCSWFSKILVIFVSPTVFTFCNKILEMEESSCLVTQYSNFNLTSNQVIYALCMQLFPHKTYCFSSESQMQFKMTRLLHIAHKNWAKTDSVFHTIFMDIVF